MSFALALVGLAIFLRGMLRLPRKKSLFFLLTFLFIHCLFTFYWVTFPINEFTGIPTPYSHLFGSVFFGVNFGHYFFIWFVTKSFKFEKFFPDERQRLLALALIVASLDFYYPQILPLNAGHIFYFLSSPLWASLGGTALLTFVLIYGILLFWSSSKKFRFYLVAVSVVIFMAVELSGQPEKKDSRKIMVSLVQPNIARLEKIKAELGERQALHMMMQVLARQTRKGKGLVFWPETAIPLFVPYAEILPGPNQHPLYREIFARHSLVFGAFVKEGERKATNSLLAWDAGKLQRYDKGFLKPFAEELPFGFTSPMITRLVGLDYPVVRGANQNQFELQGVRFLGSVCYEALKPNYLLGMLRSSQQRPHFLINVANDGWFDKVSQPYLHFFMNEFLAEQLNLPVIRASNTGISGIAFPDGRKSITTPWHEESVLNAEITYFETTPTLFEKWGFLSTLGLAMILFVFHFLLNFFKRKG